MSSRRAGVEAAAPSCTVSSTVLVPSTAGVRPRRGSAGSSMETRVASAAHAQVRGSPLASSLREPSSSSRAPTGATRREGSHAVGGTCRVVTATACAGVVTVPASTTSSKRRSPAGSAKYDSVTPPSVGRGTAGPDVCVHRATSGRPRGSAMVGCTVTGPGGTVRSAGSVTVMGGLSMSTVTSSLLDAGPSVTSSEMTCTPGGRSTLATAPVARVAPLASFQVKASTSPSASVEALPSRRTRVSGPVGWSIWSAPAAATGGELTMKAGVDTSAMPSAVPSPGRTR